MKVFIAPPFPPSLKWSPHQEATFRLPFLMCVLEQPLNTMVSSLETLLHSLYINFSGLFFLVKSYFLAPIDVSSVPHWVQHSLVCSVKLFRCVPNLSSQCAISFSMSPSWPADLWALKYAYTLHVPFSFPWNVLYDKDSQISLKLKIMCMLVNKYSCYTPPRV